MARPFLERGGSMTRPRSVPASYLVPLVVLATACSSASDPAQPLGTVLFTNSGPESYFGGAVGRAGFDTVLAVDPGTQVCLALHRAQLRSAARAQLLSVDQVGFVLGSHLMRVASASCAS